MERIVYQKTLDVHKNGIQFTLQGFETADNLSRKIEISLMASGDAIDFPLEQIEAIMYVITPNAAEPSINKCTIKNNTVIYDVLPIVEEGITEMQLKLMETSPEGAKCVLATPKFAVEVTKSNTNEESAVQTTTFSALETAVAKAKGVYDARFLRMELSSDCMFRVYYADGTVYESDMLRELFHKGESILSQSYARGDTGIRTGEEVDNAMYYSKVAKSASIESHELKVSAQEILDEVRKHGVYTAFSVNFETGDVEYTSPRYSFKVNTSTGDLEAEGESYILEDEIGLIVNDWLIKKNIDINKLLAISDEHEEAITKHAEEIDALKLDIEEEANALKLDMEEEANALKLDIEEAKKYQEPWNVDENVGQINFISSSFRVEAPTGVNSTNSGSYDITMINTGCIYLQLSVYKIYPDAKAVLTILQNGVEYKTVENPGLTEAGSTSEHHYTELIPLSVSKNDVITIHLVATTTGTGVGAVFLIDNIRLFANMETPYKYFNLNKNTYISTDSTSKVLDALLGVTD